MNSIDIKSNKLIHPIDLGLRWLFDYFFALLLNIVPYSIKGTVEKLKKSKATYNVLGLTVFNAIGGFLLLITQIKLANILGSSLYGIYAYCLAIGEVGSNFVRYGRHKTMLRDLVQHPDRQDFLICNTFMLSLINLTLFIAIILFFHTPLGISISPTYILLIISPCLISLDFQMVYEATNLISWHAIYNFLQKLLFLCPVWISIAFFSTPLWLIAVVSCLSWIIVLALQYNEVTRGLKIKIFHNISLKNIFSLYRENALVALICCCEIAFAPLIRLVLKHYADNSAVGIFSAGLQIYAIALFLLTQVSRVGTPQMAHIGKSDTSVHERKLFVQRYLVIMIACILPFSFALLVFPKAITSVFFTVEYTAISGMLPILGIYLLLYAIGNVFIQFLIALRKDKTYFTIFLLGAIATITFTFAFVPTHGIIGATLALCAPHGLACLAYCFCSLRYLRSNA